MDWTDFYKKNSEIYLLEHISRWEDGLLEAGHISSYLKSNYPELSWALDIPCGVGRILIGLGMKGFYGVGIDFSKNFVDYAKDMASKYGVTSCDFFVDDISQLGKFLPREKPVVIINWWTSFGYKGAEYDLSFFTNMFTHSCPGTVLMVETWHRKYIINNPIKRRWRDFGGYVSLVESEIEPENSAVRSIHYYYKKSDKNLDYITSFSSTIQLYGSSEILQMLETSGWSIVDVFNSISERLPFDSAKDRIVVVATKR